jgi:hypothetical protein
MHGAVDKVADGFEKLFSGLGDFVKPKSPSKDSRKEEEFPPKQEEFPPEAEEFLF